MFAYVLFFLFQVTSFDAFAQDSLNVGVQVDTLVKDSLAIDMTLKDTIVESLGLDTIISPMTKRIKALSVKKISPSSPKKVKEEKVLDPEQVFARKAAKWAILPGGGQIYNKKWWKVPIAWSMIGAGVYFIYNSASNMRVYNQALDMRNSGNVDRFNGVLSEEQVISYRNYYRRNLQLSIFGTAGLWSLTILDAVVDAHLKTYDISDDLSIKFKPKVLRVYNNSVPSLAITLYL